jgi:hypothetical protein
MSKRSVVLFDHIPDYLQFISNAQSFWFTLNTSMTMAATSPVDSIWTRKTTRLCRLSSCRPGVVLSCQLVVALPLVVLSLRRPLVVLSRQLVVASPLAVLSLRCPLVVLSRQLVVALPLAILLLRHPLVNSSRQLVVALPLLVLSLPLRPAPPSRPLAAPAGCCVASRLSMRRPLVVSLSRRAASCCLVVPAGCRAIIPCRPFVATPSRRLLVLAGCCVACPSCATLSSSRRSPSPTPSNAVERCCRHRTPPPPPPSNAISIVHRCHSCRPSPPSNANAHLRPSPLSNADARRRHPPPLMSISLVASSSFIRIPHRRCRRTLPLKTQLLRPATTIAQRTSLSAASQKIKQYRHHQDPK